MTRRSSSLGMAARRLAIGAIGLASLVLFPGCQSAKTKTKSGTELESDANGKFRLATYVSPEEYDRMTPEERQRLNAQVGGEVTAHLWGPVEKSPRDVPMGDLDRAQQEARRAP